MNAIDRLLDAAEAVRMEWCSDASEEMQQMINQRLDSGWSMRLTVSAPGHELIRLELLSPDGSQCIPLDRFVIPDVVSAAVN